MEGKTCSIIYGANRSQGLAFNALFVGVKAIVLMNLH